jgi:hypothetical protein
MRRREFITLLGGKAPERHRVGGNAPGSGRGRASARLRTSSDRAQRALRPETRGGGVPMTGRLD